MANDGAVDQARDRDAAGRPRNSRPRDALGRPLPRGTSGVDGVPDLYDSFRLTFGYDPRDAWAIA